MTTHTASVDVWGMFDRIAPRYDLLNRLLSFGRDIAWRNRLAGRLEPRPYQRVLDLATGTADVLLALTDSPNVERALGVDASFEMLVRGNEKIARRGKTGTASLLLSDARKLPIGDDQFDAVTVAFGIRNMGAIPAALTEMRRVLKPGGKILILEFSLPGNVLFRAFYLFYFRHILPRIGGVISGDRSAYRYLNRTVEAFPYGGAFLELMTKAGFQDSKALPLTFGVATLYEGEK